MQQSTLCRGRHSRRPSESRRGWSYWSSVWAAWCPTCEQETMPFPSGRCAFCNSHLEGQPTRGPYDPPLTHGRPASAIPAAESNTITAKAA
jgi:hypothetical protein